MIFTSPTAKKVIQSLSEYFYELKERDQLNQLALREELDVMLIRVTRNYDADGNFTWYDLEMETFVNGGFDKKYKENKENKL